MLIDANVLIYSVDETSVHHRVAHDWLNAAWNGSQRVALPWQTIGAFVRITTHPKISSNPLSAKAAWQLVESWLELDVVWIPPTTAATARIFGTLLQKSQVTANLVTDAQLASIAIECGIAVVSFDSDFARFPECRWLNPAHEA